MKKVFLDANIFISFLDETRKNYKNANELLKRLYDDENTIMIFSNDILTNIVYNSKGLRKEAVSMIKNINKNSAFHIANFTNNPKFCNRKCKLVLRFVFMGLQKKF